MRIKICGIKTLETAKLITKLGADAVGFIFHESSPRYITVEKTQKITLSLPPWINKVGVFVKQSPEEIMEIIDKSGLDTIQLHGGQDGDFIRRLRKLTNLPVIRALRMETLNIAACRNADMPEINGILVDVEDSREWGGTGKRVALPDGISVADREYLRERVIIAGGVNTGNVAEVVHTLKPFGLDLSSGLESKKGVKNDALIREFFAVYSELQV